MALEGKRVLVLGATGFIGCRLAERLASEQKALVTGVGRRLDRVPWLREAGVELRRVELADLYALHEVVSGQEIIFNLAAATGRDARDPELCRLLNVALVENLICEATEAGTDRVVHLSTIAAYGPPDQAVISEEHPLLLDQGASYGRTKAEGEVQAMKFGIELGQEVVVVRPGLVFGPRGWNWTLNMLKLIKRRAPVILGGGKGHAHPVYVDNLVDGLILAATHPKAAGEAFHFVDRPVPWAEFLGYYGQMSGRKPWGLPPWMTKFVLTYYLRFSGRTESTDDLLQYYTNRSVYSMKKAADLLDYQVRIDIEEAMRQTEEWLRDAGYL